MICLRCKCNKRPAAFGTNVTKPGGKNPYCKPCMAAILREYRAKNREHCRTYDRERKARARRWGTRLKGFGDAE